MIRTQYCCGFLVWRDEVLLVKKSRPRWQRGMLNGIGGHVEAGEDPAAAMVREFREETHIETSLSGPGVIPVWALLAVEHGPPKAETYDVHFYRAVLPDDAPRPVPPGSNDVGEALGWGAIRHVLNGMACVGNLNWLLPLAQDWRAPRAEVWVTGDVMDRPSWYR